MRNIIEAVAFAIFNEARWQGCKLPPVAEFPDEETKMYYACCAAKALKAMEDYRASVEAIELDAWRKLANAKPRVKWQRGNPPESGLYLVRLADGEMIITSFNNGAGKNKDSWGDDRQTDWNFTVDTSVLAWISTADLKTLPCESQVAHVIKIGQSMSYECRDTFQREAKLYGLNLECNVDNAYYWERTGDCWRFWQAAWNTRNESLERKAKLVPVLLEALEKAVADYGKPGGPWNVPGEPGTWISMARKAIAAAKED